MNIVQLIHMRDRQALDGRLLKPSLLVRSLTVSSKSKIAKHSKIKTMEEIYFKKLCPRIHHDLILLRTKYNKISASKAAANILKFKQRSLDQVENSGKILAWRIKQLQIQRTISTLKVDRDQIIADPCRDK